MRTMLVRANRVEERTQLHQTTALRPRRMDGTQMDAEHTPRSGRRQQLEKGMSREPRTMPGGGDDRLARQIGERIAAATPPVAKPRCRRQAFDDNRARRLL